MGEDSDMFVGCNPKTHGYTVEWKDGVSTDGCSRGCNFKIRLAEKAAKSNPGYMPRVWTLRKLSKKELIAGHCILADNPATKHIAHETKKKCDKNSCKWILRIEGRKYSWNYNEPSPDVRRRLEGLSGSATIRGHSGRPLEELTGYSTISRIIREEERAANRQA